MSSAVNMLRHVVRAESTDVGQPTRLTYHVVYDKRIFKCALNVGTACRSQTQHLIILLHVCTTGEGQSQKPLARLVSLQLDATSDGASVRISAEPQDKPAAKTHEASGASQQLSGRHQSQHQTLVVLRQHVLQTTETAASLPGLDNNEEECRKVIHQQLQASTWQLHPVYGRVFALLMPCWPLFCTYSSRIC